MELCDGYAAQGYTAICPDLFWRQQPGIQITDKSKAEWDQAMGLMKGMDQDKAVEDLKATLAAVRVHPSCSGRAATVTSLRAMSARSWSTFNSQNSPGSLTRPRAKHRCPEIMLTSPVNPPGRCVAIVRSPLMPGITISNCPEISAKNEMFVSPGLNKTSPVSTVLLLP